METAVNEESKKSMHQLEKKDASGATDEDSSRPHPSQKHLRFQNSPNARPIILLARQLLRRDYRPIN